MGFPGEEVGGCGPAQWLVSVVRSAAPTLGGGSCALAQAEEDLSGASQPRMLSQVGGGRKEAWEGAGGEQSPRG